MHSSIFQGDLLKRREFLTGAAGGVGMIAMGSLLEQEGLLASPGTQPDAANPLAPKSPHFAAKAQSCIFIFLAGGTSQLDLYDPKQELNEHTGQQLPESFTKAKRFSNIKLNESYLMGSPFRFEPHGQCGTEMSELLPYIGSCADDIALVRSVHHHAFSHGPGELEFCTGKDFPGRASVGAWLTYGLGSECQNLPGYVVLVNDRSPVTRALSWGSGFLPSVHQGVLFRSQGEAILNLKRPAGVTRDIDRRQLDTISRLNQARYQQVGDPEIMSRIAAYELAFRLQSAAPDLIDLSQETTAALSAYGVDRPGSAGDFSRNCLLARRLVERGVHCITICQRTWDFHENLLEKIPAACGEAILNLKRPAGVTCDIDRRQLDTISGLTKSINRSPHC